MSVKSSTRNWFSGNIFLDYFKGILVSLLLSLGLIILFAFSLGWFNLSDSIIPGVNLAIKGISVLLGSLIAIKGNSKGLIKGVIFGAIYIVIAFLIFSMLSNEFSFGINFLLDLLFAALLSGLVGIIKVNKASKY